MKISKSSVIPLPVEQVFEYCASKQGFLSHFPYKTTWVSGAEHWDQSPLTLEFRFGVGPFSLHYQAEITEFEKNKRFVDVMRIGPYKYFVHEHLFESVDGGTKYTDVVDFSAGFAGLFDWIIVKPLTMATFNKRHKLMMAALSAGNNQDHPGYKNLH